LVVLLVDVSHDFSRLITWTYWIPLIRVRNIL
jgi:hypothetical protein